MKTFLITGGAGFIGSAVIRHIIESTTHRVVNVDKLTYAGNLSSLKNARNSKRYCFEQVDICDIPRSPWLASPGCTKNAGDPVLASVAAILLPI